MLRVKVLPIFVSFLEGGGGIRPLPRGRVRQWLVPHGSVNLEF